MQEQDIHKALCTKCGEMTGKAIEVRGTTQTPSHGDIGICVMCETILEFGADLVLREASPYTVAMLRFNSDLSYAVEALKQFRGAH